MASTASLNRPPAPTAARAWGGRLAVGLLTLAGLFAVQLVHRAGETLLALTLLVITALALWAYTSARTQALRYLFPGLAAALVFVVFPMLYTVGLGFTNYSSRNLLDEARVRQDLLAETVLRPGSERAFSLHGQPGALRLVLQQPDGTALVSPVLALAPAAAPFGPTSPAVPAVLTPKTGGVETLGPPLPLSTVVQHLPALRHLRLQAPDGSLLQLHKLQAFAQLQPLYLPAEAGALTDRLTGQLYRPDAEQGFFTNAQGHQLQPGYRVAVGWRHYASIFSEGKFREPFLGVFVWTVVFSGLTVFFAAGLGLFLAVLLNWEALPGKGAYRMVLFLPYAVPGFISILVFKGLFNQNLGEVNLILNALFGVKPAWFSDPLLAKLMLLIVNVWLGFPYMMVLCSGLIKSIPADLYEASAVVGAGPWVNFRRITLPLILKPLTPLLISAFAFNFNNFVLISLLTGGRPDQLDSTLPAGTTDILVSYTWRIAFQDSGQQFGLASAISTVIFLIVAAITLVQMRFTRLNEAAGR
jgi:maltose/maltodextrin transport system permease protein